MKWVVKKLQNFKKAKRGTVIMKHYYQLIIYFRDSIVHLFRLADGYPSVQKTSTGRFMYLSEFHLQQLVLSLPQSLTSQYGEYVNTRGVRPTLEQYRQSHDEANFLNAKVRYVLKNLLVPSCDQ